LKAFICQGISGSNKMKKTKQACPTPKSMVNQDFVVATRDFFLSTGNKPIALGPLPSQSQASTAIPKLLRCDHDLKVTRYLTRNVSIKILSSLLDLSIS